MNDNNSVFKSGFFEQRKTIESLIEESRADGDFYLFVSFGVFITTLGLHIDNPIIVIGAMLITPILFPILALGMGVVTSSQESIRRSISILLKTLVVGILVSFITSFILNQHEMTEQIINASTPNLLYFFIAFASGVIASYSWVKQSISRNLPGVAISVALVPPLSAIGISLSLFSQNVFSGSVMLFIINLIGIVLASILVFSLFGFGGLRKIEEREIQNEKREVEEALENENVQ